MLLFLQQQLLFSALYFSIFSKKEYFSEKIMLITVLTTMSIAGRFIFAPFPGFKPVTAVVIIAGMYLGIEAGFTVGRLPHLLLIFTSDRECILLSRC